MEEDMRRIMTTRNSAKRLDAMIALPLARFRRALSELTSEELSALEARIAVHNVKSRWARGGHGVARHRSTLELSYWHGGKARRGASERSGVAPRRSSASSKPLRLFASWRRRIWKSARRKAAKNEDLRREIS